jgi:hypothetical protein
VIVQLGEFLQKCAILFGCVIVCGLAGFVIPLFFDQDVGGALAAELLGVVGLVIGVVIGIVVIRRRFDWL